MLNVADSFYLLGLNMDPTEIHRRMRNVKVMKVDSHYMENCEANAMPYEADSKSKPNMMFCEMDACKYTKSLFERGKIEEKQFSYYEIIINYRISNLDLCGDN